MRKDGGNIELLGQLKFLTRLKPMKPDLWTSRFPLQCGESPSSTRPPEEQSVKLIPSPDGSNFFETEKRKKSDQHQNTPSDQFIPTFARDFLDPVRNALVMNQRPDNVLQHRNHPYEYADDDGAINDRHDQRLSSQPSPHTQGVSNHDDLGQNCRLDQKRPIVEVSTCYG